MSKYRQTCTCSHDIDTHYKDAQGRRMTCLGVHCECKRYVDELEGDGPPTKRTLYLASEDVAAEEDEGRANEPTPDDEAFWDDPFVWGHF